MTPSQVCLDQIKEWESFGLPMLTVQPDTGGEEQIGWGHQLRKDETFEDPRSITWAQWRQWWRQQGRVPPGEPETVEEDER